jgi:hypothetical protein
MTHNKSHVPDANELGAMGMKKIYTFHKWKRGSCDFEGATSRIDKVLSKKFM